jgi:hypothetical protein
MDIKKFDTSLKQEIPELKQNPFINKDDIENVVWWGGSHPYHGVMERG